MIFHLNPKNENIEVRPLHVGFSAILIRCCFKHIFSAETSSSRVSAVTVVLPWGAQKETVKPQQIEDMDLRPGEFVMRTLFADFTSQAEKKIDAVMTEHVR